MTNYECRVITDRIDYIMPHVKDEMVKKELEDIRFQCTEMTETKYLTGKEYMPDLTKDLEIIAKIKLGMAIEVLNTMMEELGLTMQQFLGHYMYLYDLEPEDVYMLRKGAE